MTAAIVFEKVAWAYLAPLIALAVGALAIVSWSSFAGRARRDVGRYLLLLSAAVAAASTVFLWTDLDRYSGTRQVLGSALVVDRLFLFSAALVCASVFLCAVGAGAFLRREGVAAPEAWALLAMSGIGGVVMAGAGDLLVMFVALETLSLGAYVLAGYDRRRLASLEAGLKYFFLGAVASAFFLYGVALLYGATGTTDLTLVRASLEADPGMRSGMTVVGSVLVLIGLAFKVAAVPFHLWAPDVYRGAPTPFVGYLASGVKVAAFAATLRVFSLSLAPTDDWRAFVYALAVASLLVGSMGAVVQTDVRRVLAYSSVSHAGFMLVGVHAASQRGFEAVLVYLAAYSAMVIGAFTILSVHRSEDGVGPTLAEMKNFQRTHPALGFALMVLLFAQAGMPFTSGFVAKFSVVVAAAETEEWFLATVAMLSAVVAAYAYLRILVAMYFAHDDEAAERDGRSRSEAPSRVAKFRGVGLVAGLCAALTLFIGFAPGPVQDLAARAAQLVGPVAVNGDR
ncbi:MAG: hypothetical protein KatS3mg008_1161 [Acidimicrobiales bacterium]|nr:MAG: hypothetical protein KatS3mg008_1161 [Acidimicrobiales bacterium]